MSLGKKLFKGAGLSVLEHAAKIGALFVSTPFMVRYLGQEGYGQWLLGMAILGYLAMLDLGMSLAVSRFLSTAIGAGDAEKQSAILELSRRYFHRMGWVVAAGSVAAGPLALLILGGQAQVGELVPAVLVCGLSLALRFRYRMPGLLLRSHVRYDLLAVASIVRVLLQTAAMCLALKLGGGLLAVGLLQAAGDLLELGLQGLGSRGLRRAAAASAVVPGSGSLGALRQQLFGYTRDSMLASLGDTLRHQVGALVLGSVRGARELAVYSMGLRLILTYVDVCNAAFGGGVLMAFGQLHGAGDSARIEREFRRLTKVTAGFAAWAMGGIVFLAEPFLQRWLGPGFEDSYTTVMILALPFGLLGMQYPAYSLLAAMGHQKYLMWISGGGGVVTAMVTIPAAMAWGSVGVTAVLGVEIALTVVVLIPLLLRKCLGIPYWSYVVADVAGAGCKAVLLPAALGWWMRDWRQPDYGVLVLCGAVYTLGFVLPAPWLLLDGEGRRLLWRLFGKGDR